MEMPVAAFAGKTREKYTAKLVPSNQEQPSIALLTDFDEWKTFVETTSILRLQPLKYAVSNRNQVLIIGQPLPAIKGRSYWQKGQLLIPVGYDFNVSIVGDLLSQQLSPQKTEYILLDEQSNWEKIPVNNLVQVSRSGVRLTELPDQDRPPND